MLSRLIPPVTPDNRLSAMFWGYLAFSAVYLGSYSLSAARAVYVPPSTWDLSVPLWPGSIWVYLSQTILLPAAFLSTDDAHDLTRAYRAMLSSTFLSGVIFLVWPTTVGQTVAPPTGVTGFAWTLLYSLDTWRWP